MSGELPEISSGVFCVKCGYCVDMTWEGMCHKCSLLARKGLLQDEIDRAREEYYSFEIISLNRSEIKRIDELLSKAE